jgi:pyruvate formate lyase activating enzyme
MTPAPQSANPRSGTIFNCMRFAVNDGPGIRTTVFLKGCPLRCIWCHNPESQETAPSLLYAPERCLSCGDCVHACTHGALRWDGGPVRDQQKCELCGDCCNVCVSEARRLTGYRVTTDQLLQTILRDRILYDESSGGVTFSGGEPLSQPEFLQEILTACRAEGIHTTVDTCGYAKPDTFVRVCSHADMLLFDLKGMDSQRHGEVTGVGNEMILENLKIAAKMPILLVVRIPVVPGVNDEPANISATMEFLKSIGVARVDLLAYHQTGQEKYRRLGRECKYLATPPSSAQMETLLKQFSEHGFSVRVGG